MNNRFVPLCLDEKIRRTRRHLPHWEQTEISYFVTFRTADSLPRDRLSALEDLRKLWLRLHPPPWSAAERNEYARAAFHKLDGWLDQGAGACVLRQPELARIVENALLQFDGVRYFLDETVIMPNHSHAVLRPAGAWRLKQILHSWKSFTASRINATLEASGQFWFHESFDRAIRDWQELERIRQYIRNNPSKAGLKAGEYRLSRGIGIVQE